MVKKIVIVLLAVLASLLAADLFTGQWHKGPNSVSTIGATDAYDEDGNATTVGHCLRFRGGSIYGYRVAKEDYDAWLKDTAGWKMYLYRFRGGFSGHSWWSKAERY